MKALLFSFLLLTHLIVQAQLPVMLSPEEMQEDLTQLQQAVEEYYAGSLVGLSKEAFLYILADYQAGLNAPKSRLAFFRELSLLVSQSGERHFRISPRWNLSTVSTPSSGYFPFTLKFVGRSAYIFDKKAPQYQIKPGSKLVAVNGKKISQLVIDLFPYIVSDGSIVSSKYYDLAKNFAFYYYYYVEPAASFQLELIAPKGSLYHIKVPATHRAPLASRDRIQRKVEASAFAYTKDQPFTFTLVPNSGSAILSLQTLNDAAFKEGKALYHTWIKERFQDLKQNKVQQLILDLRNNPGGRIDYLFELFSYLLPSQYPGAIKHQRTHDGRFDIFKFPSPKPEAFEGKLYVLINGGTFSAASELAGFLKSFTDCTLLGIESAGSYQGFAAGTFHSVNLTNAQVSLKIPEHLYQFNLSPQRENGRGVLPDIYIEQYIGDLLQGEDTQLRYAMEFAKRAYLNGE